MTNLVATIKKLRAAADILEELLYEGTSTKALAKRMEVGDVPLRERPLKRKYKPRKPKFLHWTQRPENAKRLAQWRKAATARAKARRLKVASGQ